MLFRDTRQDPDTTALDRWLEEMQRSYKLIARDSYAVPIYGKWDAPPDSIQDYIEVFKFVPMGSGGMAHRAAGSTPTGCAVGRAPEVTLPMASIPTGHSPWAWAAITGVTCRLPPRRFDFPTISPIARFHAAGNGA